MICSNCNISLILSKKQGVSIEFCPQCNSIWQVKGRYRRAIKKSLYFNSPNSADYISDGQILENHEPPKVQPAIATKKKHLHFSG